MYRTGDNTPRQPMHRAGTDNAACADSCRNSAEFAMARCTRCCLNYSLRILNLILTLYAIAMIIYSLWLQKKWNEGVAQLPTRNELPRPWFIYTCFGVGIAVCLSTLLGHMVANHISYSSLCIYIVAVCSLLFLEGAVVVVIFFKYNWAEKIAENIDEYHDSFKRFVFFHLKMCQLIALIILVPQINILAIAVILWAVGMEPVTCSHEPDMADFTQSFLVGPNMLMLNGSRGTCRCETVLEESPCRTFLSYMKGMLRFPPQRTIVY